MACARASGRGSPAYPGPRSRVGDRRERYGNAAPGEQDRSPRESFFYLSDTGELIGLRYDRWKFVFAEQRAEQFMVWSEPFVTLRLPKIFDLRMDPFERADIDSNTYMRWWTEHVFLLVPAQTYVAETLQSLAEFPPRQRPASFNMEQVLESLGEGQGG